MSDIGGLEWQHVTLVGFSSHYKKELNQLNLIAQQFPLKVLKHATFARRKDKENEQPSIALRDVLHRLYTVATRAKESLRILDEHPFLQQLTQTVLAEHHVSDMNIEKSLQASQKPHSTPIDWLHQAKIYLEEGSLQQVHAIMWGSEVWGTQTCTPLQDVLEQSKLDESLSVLTDFFTMSEQQRSDWLAYLGVIQSEQLPQLYTMLSQAFKTGQSTESVQNSVAEQSKTVTVTHTVTSFVDPAAANARDDATASNLIHQDTTQRPTIHASAINSLSNSNIAPEWKLKQQEEERKRKIKRLFYLAETNGNRDEFCKLMADPLLTDEVINREGNDLLIKAIEKNSQDFISILVNMPGIDVNKISWRPMICTPLIFAIKKNRNSAVKLLVASERVKLKSDNSLIANPVAMLDPLFSAIANRNAEAASCLIRSPRQSVNYQCNSEETELERIQSIDPSQLTGPMTLEQDQYMTILNSSLVIFKIKLHGAQNIVQDLIDLLKALNGFLLVHKQINHPCSQKGITPILLAMGSNCHDIISCLLDRPDISIHDLSKDSLNINALLSVCDDRTIELVLGHKRGVLNAIQLSIHLLFLRCSSNSRLMELFLSQPKALERANELVFLLMNHNQMNKFEVLLTNENFVHHAHDSLVIMFLSGLSMQINELVKSLSICLPSLLKKSPEHNCLLLFGALWYQYLDVAETILSSTYFDINRDNINQLPFLHQCVLQNNQKAVELLIQYQTPITHCDHLVSVETELLAKNPNHVQQLLQAIQKQPEDAAASERICSWTIPHASPLHVALLEGFTDMALLLEQHYSVADCEHEHCPITIDMLKEWSKNEPEQGMKGLFFQPAAQKRDYTNEAADSESASASNKMAAAGK